MLNLLNSNKIENNIIFAAKEVESIRNEGEEKQQLSLKFMKGWYLHHRVMASIWSSLDDKARWDIMTKNGDINTGLGHFDWDMILKTFALLLEFMWLS